VKNILITGGTGLIGSQLGLRLQQKGYHVSMLSRSGKSDSSFPLYQWDPDKGEIDVKALDQADYIIHLAGVNIGGKRWSPERKQQILDSRVKSGELIFRAVEQRNRKPMAFITASAIGYYGAVTTDVVFDETAPASHDFLGSTCASWEGVADRFETNGIRSVKIRCGIVLSKQGGALSRLSLPIKFGVGAPIGNGGQYMPWIHIDDLCGIFTHAIERSHLNGPFNAVAPEHITNRGLTEKLARELKKALWMPNIPAGFMRLLFGEMSVMLLQGSKVSPEKILAAGYSFQFPDLGTALRQLNAE
jgi:uncharacterized protein (TIGR01777 family)